MRGWSAPQWAALLCALTIVLSIGGPLVGRGVFLGADIAKTFPPWNGTTASDFVYRHGPIDDTIDFYAPERELIRDAIVHDHRIPLWNEYPNGGTPLGSVPNDGLLSPLEWPMLLLGISFGAAWMALFRLALAAACTAALCRRLGVSRFASNCAAIVYCTSGFLIAWNNWPHSNIAAWIPALFLIADITAEKRRMRDVGLLGVVVAAMLLEGYPPLVVVTMYTLLPFLAIRAWQRCEPRDSGRPTVWQRIVTRLRAAVAVTGGVVFGAALSAFQVLPFGLRLSELNLAYRESSQRTSLPAASLLTTVFPWAAGSPAHPASGLPNFVDSFAFVGGATIVFAIVAVLAGAPNAERRALHRFLIAAVLVIALPVFTGTAGRAGLGRLVGDVLYALPLMKQVPIERLIGPFLFIVALLAAFGIDSAVTNDHPAKPILRAGGPWPPMRRVKLALAVFVSVYLIDAVVRSEQRLFKTSHQGGWIIAHSIPAALITATAVVVVLIARRGRTAARNIAIYSIPALLVVEALLVTTVAYARVPKSDYFPDQTTIAFLQHNLGSYRYAAADDMLFPSAGTHYHLRAVNGHSFSPQSWRDTVAVTSNGSTSLPTLTIVGHSLSAATSPQLDRLAAKYFVVSPDAIAPYGTQVAAPTATGTHTVQTGKIAAGMVAGGPLRAVSVQIAGATKFHGTLVVLDATVRDANGVPVASGVRRLRDQQHTTTWFVPITGELLPKQGASWRVELGLRSNNGADQASLASTSTSGLALGTVRPANDGLLLAHVDEGALVWRRLNALPRIRWASNSDIVLDNYKATIGLALRKTDPNAVLLDETASPASGEPARVTVLQDSSEHIRVRAAAKGFGYLVIADAIQSGWAATLDGRSVPLRAADRGSVAIPVGGGTHVIDLKVAPKGWHLGIAISLFAFVGGLVLFVLVFERKRRGARAAAFASPA
jgi:hypothetical protein